MKKIFITLSVFMLILTQANAGVNGLTYHSRANCAGFNESITWDARWYRTYFTVSGHFYKGAKSHELETGWENTWRSAAYHATEGYGDWYVIGYHWMVDEDTGRPFYLSGTSAADCNIYDGWWDSNKRGKLS